MNLDIELDEVEEGDVVACDECGTEYEVVGVEPLELARVDEDSETKKTSSSKRKRRKSESEPRKLAAWAILLLLAAGMVPWRRTAALLSAMAQAQNLGQRTVSGAVVDGRFGPGIRRHRLPQESKDQGDPQLYRQPRTAGSTLPR